MCIGLIIVPIISLFTKAPDTESVDKAFAAYDRKVSVPVKDDLG